MLEFAGYKNICIKGVQRYPLSNHLYWLSKGKPGGQYEWDILDSPNLKASYEEVLAKLDCTDTLVAVATI